VAGPDFDSEIKQLQATMSTIGKVLDLPAMESEIADLAEQVAAPDLWDDQANATRVTGRCPRSRARSTASPRCRAASTTSS
jgi:peptide chain release factor 2